MHAVESVKALGFKVLPRSCAMLRAPMTAETVLTNAVARGFDRGLAEEKLDELSNEGTLHEPRFGWFRIVS